MTSKSKQAKILENIAKNVIIPKGTTMTEVILSYRKARKKQKYNLPLFVKIKDDVDEIISDDMKLFYMNVESESDTLIVYLHGGAYVEEMLPFHWLMLDKITNKVDSTFIIPEYPLAPYYDFKDCYKKMLHFYEKVLKYYKDKKIVFMGDSAGAGLALGLNMYFVSKGLKAFDKLILLSPWLDLTMSNKKMKDYFKIDPTLRYDDLCVDAKFWANGSSLKDYRISPTYGDVKSLKDVTIFVGTHELLYPDIIEFKEKLDQNNIKNRLFIGNELGHVYPAYPTPEADEAIEKICKIINER